MSEQPKPTLREAASSLWHSFFDPCPGVHPYIQAIATGDGTIIVWLVIDPMRHERQIPSEWQGWPVKTRVVGRMRLC